MDRLNTKPLSFVSGLRILITGEVRVFGRALVIEAARQGATVAATGREPSISAASFPPASKRSPRTWQSPQSAGRSWERAASLLGGLDDLSEQRGPFSFSLRLLGFVCSGRP